MWICQKCNTQNTANFCGKCGASVNVQEAFNLPPMGRRGMSPQFQAQNYGQFPPHQPAQMSPQQFTQPQMPPIVSQKPGGLHNLLVVGFVAAVFALAIGFILWVAVFGAKGAEKVIPILVILAGLLITVINIALVVRKIWRIKKFTKTTGVVINVESRQGMSQYDSSTRNTLFNPTVRFQTADGRIVDYTPKIASSWNNYRVGESVPVFYDPQQPENPTVGKPGKLWFPHFLFGIVGGMSLLGGAIAILVIFF